MASKKPTPLLIFALTIIGLAGCAEGRASAAPVDPKTAKDSLVRVLDHWKSGGLAEDLKAVESPVIARDRTWEAGKRLLRYEILPEELNDGPTLHYSVRLVVAAGAKEQVVMARYAISTSPVVTVLREIG